jgi:hypothetical protein
MKTKYSNILVLTIITALILTACQFPTPTAIGEIESTTTQNKSPEATPPPTQIPEVRAAETSKPTATSTAVEETPTDELPQTVGPEDFPAGINPLTGLPAGNPDYLNLPPALLSISNFPASARPQAGINSSPIVFEMTIGEGMTRFLAVFYGQFPELVSGQTEGDPPAGSSGTGETSDDESTGDGTVASQSLSIGPIRSGRLPYEDIRSIYSGFLVMASAYSGVAQTLSKTTSIYGSDSDDINSAMIDVNQLYQIAQSRAEGYPGSNFNLAGMKFSPTPPEGGKAAENLWVFYSSLNQIQWIYDADLGAYIRYDIKTDGSGEFVMATDRLTGEPVSRENVIVIFALHNFLAPTLIDIQLNNMPPIKALLFRDGEMHEIFWTTKFGEYEQSTGLLRPMRFIDAEGNPVALKNGYTWIHIVTTYSYYVESAIGETPFYPVKEEEGTGRWLVRYKGKY